MFETYRGKPLPLQAAHEVTVAPTFELLTVDDLRTHLRLPSFPGQGTNDTENAYLMSLIKTCGGAVETYTRRPIRAQTRVYVVDRTRLNRRGVWASYSRRGADTALVFNSAPWRTVRAIRYYRDGAAVVVPDTDYRVEGLGGGTRRTIEIYPTNDTTWPWCDYYVDDDSANIEVEVECGWATADDVPDEIKHAARIWCRGWYAKREEVVTGTIASPVPTSAKFLLNGFRRKVF